jgi:tetratricopeptide (TPR) repeat protein
VLTAIHDVRGEAYALQSLGVIHRERGSIKEAEQCLVTALEKFGATRDRRFEAYTMRSLGLLLRGQDRTAEAAALFKSASSILQTLGDRYGQASLLQDLGEVEQDPDRAHQLMEEALQLALEIHNQFVEARCLRGLGVLHHDLGELELAEDCLGRSLLLWKDLRMPLYAARSQDRLGRVQEALGRWSEAQDSWREALAVFRRLGAPEAEPLAERLAAADRATRARGKM